MWSSSSASSLLLSAQRPLRSVL
uniref:Uncharacterized protein n=1 Tax=Arundo donax TaxID=35708 RepID=A0A0A9HDZ9_ARUDO